MILPSLFLKEKANKTFKFSGIDSLENALDKNHFLTFPHTVLYNYNSRGFRDSEWPNNLSNAIWCFGDSFTVGLGSPFKHIWPQILEQRSKKRCINVSMDGASNEWIARQALSVINEISPHTLVIQWSFIWRSELKDETLSDEQRRIHFLPQDNFATAFKRFTHIVRELELQKKSTKIIHSSIPGFTDYTVGGFQHLWPLIKGTDWPNDPIASIDDFHRLPDRIKIELKRLANITEQDYIFFLAQFQSLCNEMNWIEPFIKLDLARDGFHYDIKTSTLFVNELLNYMEFDAQ